MASIQRSGAKWRAQVYVQGVRDSDTFRTRQEAAQWALEREAELSGKKLPAKSLGDAMKDYARKVAPEHKGAHWEQLRLTAMQRWPIAKRKLAGLAGNDLAEWRDGRLKQVKPGTVAREMNLLRSVLEVARVDWHWIRVNPLADVRWHRVGLAFLFALETAMRSSEILGLTWPHVHLAARYVQLPRTKNGDRRDVPLSTRAVQILQALPQGEDPVFNLNAKMRDALWRKTRPAAHQGIHFHDTRAEAIWRLSKKLDVLQLARVIGHRDPKSLLIYYDESAADMAKRLD
jgi:integrase